MTYIYQQINESDFCQAFVEAGRKDQFSYEGRQAQFEYLEGLAEDVGNPIELDVIALCCDFSEYADIEEFNKERESEYRDWDEVASETTVIPHSGGAAIIQEF